MSAHSLPEQTSLITKAAREVLDRGESWCATFEISNDPNRWLQFTIDVINAAYPFAEDPLTRLRAFDVLEVVSWEQHKFASVKIAAADAEATPAWIDRYFADVLSCGDSYDLKTTLEDMNA